MRHRSGCKFYSPTYDGAGRLRLDDKYSGRAPNTATFPLKCHRIHWWPRPRWEIVNKSLRNKKQPGINAKVIRRANRYSASTSAMRDLMIAFAFRTRFLEYFFFHPCPAAKRSRGRSTQSARINFRVQTSLKPLCNRGVSRLSRAAFASSFLSHSLRRLRQ